jgi:protein ImuB
VLEHPLSRLEPLLFVLARLTQELCAALAARGQGARELELSFGLEGAPSQVRRIRLAFAMRDPRLFLKLLEIEIEARPPGAPILDVALSAEPGPGRMLQRGLFVSLAPEPEKLALVLARLTKLAGDGNVGAPELVDTHRPDAFRTAPFAGGGEQRARAPKRLVVGFHRFRPPLPAHVRLERGAPVHLVSRSRGAQAISGSVAARAGPWRSSGEWWTPGAWAREEWDVGLRDGATCRIYRDLTGEGWFVDGVYD